MKSGDQMSNRKMEKKILEEKKAEERHEYRKMKCGFCDRFLHASSLKKVFIDEGTDTSQVGSKKRLQKGITDTGGILAIVCPKCHSILGCIIHEGRGYFGLRKDEY